MKGCLQVVGAIVLLGILVAAVLTWRACASPKGQATFQLAKDVKDAMYFGSVEAVTAAGCPSHVVVDAAALRAAFDKAQQTLGGAVRRDDDLDADAVVMCRELQHPPRCDDLARAMERAHPGRWARIAVVVDDRERTRADAPDAGAGADATGEAPGDRPPPACAGIFSPAGERLGDLDPERARRMAQPPGRPPRGEAPPAP